MNILKTATKSNKITFSSRNCPVKPYIIPTKVGNLRVEELSKKDEYKAAKFTFDTAVESLGDWAGQYNASEKKYYINYFIDSHNRALKKKDGNSTILIAKDKKNDIKALFLMHSFDEFREKKLVDIKTAHLDECLIDSRYRGQGVGQIMLESLIATAKGHFTDIFGEADNKALTFYKRAGFKELDMTNKHAKKIIDLVMSERTDANLITLISKSVDSTNSWLERFAKLIK